MPRHLIGDDSTREKQALRLAYSALDGVGDPQLGEWTERGNPGPSGSRIYHVRRRMSETEQRASGLHVIDMRDTERGMMRLRSLFLMYPQLKTLAIRIGEWTERPAS